MMQAFQGFLLGVLVGFILATLATVMDDRSLQTKCALAGGTYAHSMCFLDGSPTVY